MTDKVDPSAGSDGQAYMVAQAIQQHGSVGAGWIAEGSVAYAAGHTNSGVSGAPLNEFAKVSDSGLDVTFDTGEAFVGGGWVARDSQTTVTLDDDTTGQQVVLGWDYNAADTVKIGVDGGTPGDSFDSLDPTIPLYTFDTSGGSVTSTTDDRTVGKETQFGAPTLGDGTVIGRAILDAVGDAIGTSGDASGEVFRAAGNSSDAIFSLQGAGSDRLNLSWNTYHDGSNWVFLQGGEPAYRLAFESDAVVVYQADGSGASGGDTVSSWESTKLPISGGLTASSGSLTIGGTTVYDGSEVPKSELGGPASSLSSYPLPASDISDGAGSSLDADTVDGQHASDLASGRWSTIDTYEDADTTTDFEVDTGTLSTTYDQYRITMHVEYEDDDHNHKHLGLQLNGDGSNVYDTGSIDLTTGTFVQDTNKSQFQRLAGSFGDKVGAAEYVVSSPALSDHYFSDAELQLQRPNIGVVWCASHADAPALHQGSMDKEIGEVDRFRFFSIPSGDNAAGKIEIAGRDIF